VKIAVGLAEGRSVFHVALEGEFRSEAGQLYSSGKYRFVEPISLKPLNPDVASFSVEDVTIGVGFHWQRDQRQRFRGACRIVRSPDGLTLINDVELDAYVESVISSEMSAHSPMELLKTHAVISRSWVLSQIGARGGDYRSERQIGPNTWEILCWYGKESHEEFDVCADDHCQRYQGLDGIASENASRAVRETAAEFLLFEGQLCDARFSKCCGGVTEDYRSVWDDRRVPYLVPVHDGPGEIPKIDDDWICQRPLAYCNTADPVLLSRILPGFDQETTDFFRWEVSYTSTELAQLVEMRTRLDLGDHIRLKPLERGGSGRISKLQIEGALGRLIVGKELEIRKILSATHLYSSAFVVETDLGGTRLHGAGWGHGVGLCQIGAGVMAQSGSSYTEILSHYYPGTGVGSRPEG
jgi:stage II sporulation protein D